MIFVANPKVLKIILFSIEIAYDKSDFKIDLIKF